MWLPEAGLYYYKARMYAPQLGRFLQTDPIDVAGGVNLYAYVGNDPVNFIDPLGLCLLGFEKTGGGTYAGPDGPVVYATGGCRGIVTIEFSPMMSPRGERGSGEQCPAAGSAIAGIRAAASRTADIQREQYSCTRWAYPYTIKSRFGGKRSRTKGSKRSRKWHPVDR
jgi:RHS repeat-associated protein